MVRPEPKIGTVGGLTHKGWGTVSSPKIKPIDNAEWWAFAWKKKIIANVAVISFRG